MSDNEVCKQYCELCEDQITSWILTMLCHESPFETRTCKADLISTCNEAEVNDHPVNIELTYDQHNNPLDIYKLRDF